MSGDIVKSVTDSVLDFHCAANNLVAFLFEDKLGHGIVFNRRWTPMNGNTKIGYMILNECHVPTGLTVHKTENFLNFRLKPVLQTRSLATLAIIFGTATT